MVIGRSLKCSDLKLIVSYSALHKKVIKPKNEKSEVTDEQSLYENKTNLMGTDTGTDSKY